MLSISILFVCNLNFSSLNIDIVYLINTWYVRAQSFFKPALYLPGFFCYISFVGILECL